VSAVSSWDWSFDDDLRFWTSAGIDHVGLSFRKLKEAGLDASLARVQAEGLRVSNVIEVGWLRLDDEATWKAHRSRLADAVDAAATVGASCVVLTSGPAGDLPWDDAASRLRDALDPVAARAAARGVALALENTSPLRLDISFVTTLRDAVDAAQACGVGVCMEVNSCFAERGLDATIAAAHDVLALVQLNDFVIGSLCTPDRAVPGDGDIPLARIVDTVAGAGYRGAFDLELVGPRIEEEGYAAAIRRSVDRLGEIMGRR
jgi:sugar phosphate isomerase/epimerase